MSFMYASIVITCKSLSKRSCTFLRAITITQISTHSLDLSSSVTNFQTTKYSLERFFQKE